MTERIEIEINICEQCMAMVKRHRKMPPLKKFCAVNCRSRVEIYLFHEGLGPAPDWWEKSGAVFLTPPKPPRYHETARSTGLRRR